MQQTEKYKLNLIESSDPFLPDGLNQNTRKIEDAMAAHEAGIEQRLTVLEAKKIVCGGVTFTTAGDKTISLGFTPRVVFAHHPASGGIFRMAVRDQDSSYVKVVDDGFRVSANMSGTGTLIYAAFA